MVRTLNEMSEYIQFIANKNKINIDERELKMALYEDGEPYPNEQQCEQLVTACLKNESNFLANRYENIARVIMNASIEQCMKNVTSW